MLIMGRKKPTKDDRSQGCSVHVLCGTWIPQWCRIIYSYLDIDLEGNSSAVCCAAYQPVRCAVLAYRALRCRTVLQSSLGQGPTEEVLRVAVCARAGGCL